MDFVERRMAIFKAGTHTDSAGQKKEWTIEDLARIAGAYDPAGHEAPVVIGHPETNSPAFGWAKKLFIEGDTLWADAEIVPELDDLIERGLYKKRSVSLYEDGTLRHIGFLGGNPPAVKGLPDIAFNDKQVSHFEFTLNDSKNKEVHIMKFLEWIKTLAGKDGVTLDDLPRTFSEADITAQVNVEVAAKVEAEKTRLTAEFAETQKKKDDEFKLREDAIRQAEAAARKAAVASFCEGLVQKGKLTPAMMKHGMGLVNFLEQIASIETTIEFGEGDGKKKQSPIEFMQFFLAGLPKAIEFKEVAGEDKDTAPKGQAAQKLDALTRERMKANDKLTYSAAFTEVQTKTPELAAEYADSISK
jgi:hypothetical protein